MATATKLGMVQEIHEGSAAGEPEFAVRHYSPAELGQLWSLSVETIRRMFEREPGVLIFENPDKGSERRRRTMRIPESVAERVYRRLSTRQFDRRR
jgi:hypothetical protein